MQTPRLHVFICAYTFDPLFVIYNILDRFNMQLVFVEFYIHLRICE